MTVSQSIVSFTEALEATRAELVQVNAKITELESDRRTVVIARPHTDDIAAAYLLGLQSASSAFTSQFSARLTEQFVNDADAAAAAAPGKSADLLRLEPAMPDREILVTRSLKKLEPTLNVAVIAYFLREAMAEQIPALVDKLCPQARSGMKAVDRKAALEKIDAELATLREEARRLNDDLNAARLAVSRH